MISFPHLSLFSPKSLSSPVPTKLTAPCVPKWRAPASTEKIQEDEDFRRLADIRDGLKPVQRRIIYVMHLCLRSSSSKLPCADIVKEIKSTFHPHSHVYDSLVRMAQDFSLRDPLICGIKFFGSTGLPKPMFQNQCCLSALANIMLLADIENHDVVDYVYNYNCASKEPCVLPSRIPNLLLNGSFGIINKGAAANIPPHNLTELVNALLVLIRRPNAKLEEIIKYMPGPDFPTGGIVMGTDGILEVYRTGRGDVVIRGKANVVESLDSINGCSRIIIKEIPYLANKDALFRSIGELVTNKRLTGITKLRDESDQSGVRIVIEVEKGLDPYIVLDDLYLHTQLQLSFKCNMLGIFNGQPKLMGLKEMLEAFLDFRCSVVERRGWSKLCRAKARYHVVEGVLKLLNNRNRVNEIARKSSNTVAAKILLKKEFDLSITQAEALMHIDIWQMSSLEMNKFMDEGKSLAQEISKLQELLSCKQHVLELIEAEAVEIQKKFQSPRRTVIVKTPRMLK